MAEERLPWFNPKPGAEYTISPEFDAPMGPKKDKWDNDKWIWKVTVLQEQSTVGGQSKTVPINKTMMWSMNEKAFDMIDTSGVKSGVKFFLSVIPETMEKEGKIIKFNKYCLIYENKSFFSHNTSPEANDDSHVPDQEPPPPDEEYPEEVKPEKMPDKPSPKNEYGLATDRAQLLSKCLDEAVVMTLPYEQMDANDPLNPRIIEFSPEEIKSLAISLFIQVCSEQYEKLGFKR